MRASLAEDYNGLILDQHQTDAAPVGYSVSPTSPRPFNRRPISAAQIFHYASAGVAQVSPR